MAQDLAAGERGLLVAEDAQGLCGTVQLVLDQPENQPHRADLSTILVHRRARRQGLGAALVRAAEAMARDGGKTLLVLDAVTGGDAARLYERLGWARVGAIPGYAAGWALQHDGVLPYPRRLVSWREDRHLADPSDRRVPTCGRIAYDASQEGG